MFREERSGLFLFRCFQKMLKHFSGKMTEGTIQIRKQEILHSINRILTAEMRSKWLPGRAGEDAAGPAAPGEAQQPRGRFPVGYTYPAVPCQVPEPSHWVSLTSGSPSTVPAVSKMCPSSGELLMFPAVETKVLKSEFLWSINSSRLPGARLPV